MVLLIALAAVTLASGAWERSQAAGDPVIVAAGDIASCEGQGDEATAKLVQAIPGSTVVALGDMVYPTGSEQQYKDCYDPSWGQFKDRTRPTPGNHDYGQPGAAAYYDYFGAAAGKEGEGYYSYDLGAWHIVVLNSNCTDIGGCDAGSPQEQWLKADLAAHPSLCTLAVWHHPLFGSSGSHTGNLPMQPIWWDLYRAGADVVLNGHAHNYERLAPLDPKGIEDPARGMREFIVGTGGREHRQFSKIESYSEARNNNTYGVLKLALKAGSYDWQFVPVAGQSYTDAGSGQCH